jgi:hypothetical protein
MKRLLAVSAFVAFGLVALPALSQQRPAMTAGAINATGWDGTVRLVARARNDMTVYREH